MLLIKTSNAKRRGLNREKFDYFNIASSYCKILYHEFISCLSITESIINTLKEVYSIIKFLR